MPYQQSFSEKISTNVSQFPNIAQIKIKNPLKQTLFVNAIELLPDSLFTAKGDVYITISRGKAFSNDGKPLGAYSLFPVPLESQELFQGDFIEIFARNMIDADLIELSVNVKISEAKENQARGAEPLNRQSLKDDVTPFENIFPLQNRQIGDTTSLIFMSGYKSLIVLISSPILDPSVILPTSATPLICDGNLTTYEPASPYENSPKITYPTEASRIVKAILENTDGSKAFSAKLQYSSNDIDWFDDTGFVVVSVTPNKLTLGSGIARVAKYWKVIFSTSFGQSGGKCYEMYKPSDYGGTGSISFEILGADNNWITYIPSTEFSTSISIGSASIARQVGDVSNLSVTNKAYKIPSTQTRFRIKFSITDASLYNSVAIQKVS